MVVFVVLVVVVVVVVVVIVVGAVGAVVMQMERHSQTLPAEQPSFTAR